MTDQRLRVINPPGWSAPRGYSNGMAGAGEVLFVAGQIGWDTQGRLAANDFVAQFAQALANVVAVVTAAGGAPTDIARMTVYVTDLEAYRATGREVGQHWRTLLGKHYPAMALVHVAGLLERDAMVEIEATAVLPRKEPAAP